MDINIEHEDIILELIVRFGLGNQIIDELQIRFNITDYVIKDINTWYDYNIKNSKFRKKIEKIKQELEYVNNTLGGDNRIIGRLIWATGQVDYYEAVILKLEHKIKEIEELAIKERRKLNNSEHANFLKYISAIKQFKDKVADLTLLADVEKLQEILLDEVSKIILDVFLPVIDKEKWSDVVSLYKEALKSLDMKEILGVKK